MSQLTHPDHDLLLYVFHDVIPGLWVLWRVLWNEVLEVAGLNAGGHAAGVDAVLFMDKEHIQTSWIGKNY